MTQFHIGIITFLALLAFAANSLITRFALEETSIDAASFTLIRLMSGGLFLWIFLTIKSKTNTLTSGSWLAAFALFIYAACFTFGYGFIAAGTGALILFAAVQITMTVAGYLEGERLNGIQLMGFMLAITGLIILMLPGISAPSFLGATLMCISGIAWGIYTLQGRGSNAPAISTAGNFIKATPMAILLWFFVYVKESSEINLAPDGVAYALLSGIVTSGIGYIMWYSILPYLKASKAAIIQLSVPVLVTLLGALLLNENLTLRIILASMTIITGTILVLVSKKQPQ